MKHHPQSFIGAFTLLEVLLVVACLAILAAVFLPALAKPTNCTLGCVNNLKQVGVAFRTWAIDNGDKYPMAVPMTNGGTMELVGTRVVYAHFQVMSNELSTPKILVCPGDSGQRVIASTFDSAIPPRSPNTVPFVSNTNVSYFVGVDADQARSSMFLTGDANISLDGRSPRSGLQSFSTNSDVSWYQPRHEKGTKGNIGMADGSVQQASTKELRKLLRDSGATNRLVFPDFP